MALCKKFLQQSPTHGEAMRLLASIALQLGATEEAEAARANRAAGRGDRRAQRAPQYRGAIHFARGEGAQEGQPAGETAVGRGGRGEK